MAGIEWEVDAGRALSPTGISTPYAIVIKQLYEDARSQHGSSIDTEILLDLSLSRAMAQMQIIATHLRGAHRGLKTDVDAEVHDLMDEHASVCPCQFPYFDRALQILLYVYDVAQRACVPAAPSSSPHYPLQDTNSFQAIGILLDFKPDGLNLRHFTHGGWKEAIGEHRTRCVRFTNKIDHESHSPCCICMEHIQRPTLFKTSCNHSMHAACWERWKVEQVKCPVCRRSQ